MAREYNPRPDTQKKKTTRTKRRNVIKGNQPRTCHKICVRGKLEVPTPVNEGEKIGGRSGADRGRNSF